MCIALLTTAHPHYAIIIIDNRDEFILRPTSQLHWWTTKPEPYLNGSQDESSNAPQEVHVLSSRDLQRPERGTWLGISKGGNFAVLTNYRESDTHDAAHPVHAKRSRGGMVTAWLAADPRESTRQFVHRMLDEGGVKGVGGFSLICGKLRRRREEAGGEGKKEEKNIEPLAIISNRVDHPDAVPWICGTRGEAHGLSNAIYVAPGEEGDEPVWPKIRQGIDMLRDVAAKESATEEELVEDLFRILDVDNFPADHTMDLEEGLVHLKDSIFIPAFGEAAHQKEFRDAQARGKAMEAVPPAEDSQPNGFQTGLYGTQRQTIILVDWDGNVRYTERDLWDANGDPIPRGEGDKTFRFKIEGWDEALELRN